MDDVTVLDPVTPAETTNAPTPPDLTTSSGWDDLRSAFGSPFEETPATETPVETTGTNSEPTAETTPEVTPDASTELSDEEIQRVLADQRFRTQLNASYTQSLIQARQLWEQELQARRLQEEELLLDDEELGQRVRAQQQMAPILNQARQEGFAQAQATFINQGIADMWARIPELNQLDQSVKATLNPADPRFQSYGEYVGAVVNAVAETKARTMAERMAKEMAEAQVAAKVAELRKGLPNISSPSGPAGAPGPIIDVGRMSGSELLKQYFKN